MFLSVSSVCLTLNYPCPPYHPLSIPLSISLALSLSLLSLPRCLLTSCAQMAERSRQDGFLESVHAHKHPHRHTRKQSCTESHRVTFYSRDLALLSLSLKISLCSHFPHLLAAYDHINMKQMPLAHKLQQTNMVYGQRRSGIWLLVGSNRISFVTNMKVIRL